MDRGRELFRLTVYGTPAGAGSKTAEVITHKGYGRVGAALGKKLAQLGIIPPGRLPVMKDGRYVLLYRHQSKKTEPWMEAVERDAQVGWRGAAAIDGAIWVEIDCFETRPTAHFRADGSLRPDAPAHPHRTMTHDSGKQRRAIEDALTNVRIWADDKRVVDGHDRKHYCDEAAAVFEGESWREPRALIRVGVMKAQTVEQAGIASPPPAGQEQLIAA